MKGEGGGGAKKMAGQKVGKVLTEMWEKGKVWERDENKLGRVFAAWGIKQEREEQQRLGLGGGMKRGRAVGGVWVDWEKRSE